METGMDARAQLISKFEALASDRANDLAVMNDIDSVSYGALMSLVRKYRSELRALPTTEPMIIGHAVANGPDAVAIELAVWAEGHTSLAFPQRATMREYQEMLSAVTPAFVYVDTDESALASLGATTRVIGAALDTNGWSLQSQTELPAPDTLQLQFTSGSTGMPKAVCMSASAVLASLTASASWIDSFADAPVFSILPQNHAMGRASVLEVLWSGRGVVCSAKKTPGEHHAHMRATGCRTLLCNPTYARLGLALGILTQDSQLNRLVIGTAQVDAGLVSELQDKVPHLGIDIRYGVSEAFGALTVNCIAPGTAQPETGNVGHPLPGVEIAAPDDDAGPTRARAPFTAFAQLDAHGLTYLRDPQGFITTGDIGRLNTQGELCLSGRTNLSISHRGHRIDPIEIETVVKETGAIVEAVVIGIPDTMSGEKIAVAFVSTAPDSISADQIKDHCNRELSAHKVPHWAVELQEIPIKASGKPDRLATRNHILEALGRKN